MQHSVREFLNHQFLLRQKRNPLYSQRAFARDLGLSPSHLSEVLNGKQKLSVQKATVIGKELGLSTSEHNILMALAVAENARKPEVRQQADAEIERLHKRVDPHVLKEQQIAAIADGLNVVILELCSLKHYDRSFEGLLEHLPCSPSALRGRLRDLVEASLLAKKDNQYEKTHLKLETSCEIPSEAIRSLHEYFIGTGLRALHQQPISRRSFDTLVFPLKKGDIPAIKQRIRTFFEQLHDDFAAVENCDAIYSLGIQLFEIEKGLQHALSPSSSKGRPTTLDPVGVDEL